MAPVWSHYFANACCLLYVVNLSATGQLSAAVVELWGVIQHSDMQVRMLCCHHLPPAPLADQHIWP